MLSFHSTCQSRIRQAFKHKDQSQQKLVAVKRVRNSVPEKGSFTQQPLRPGIDIWRSEGGKPPRAAAALGEMSKMTNHFELMAVCGFAPRGAFVIVGEGVNEVLQGD